MSPEDRRAQFKLIQGGAAENPTTTPSIFLPEDDDLWDVFGRTHSQLKTPEKPLSEAARKELEYMSSDPREDTFDFFDNVPV